MGHAGSHSGHSGSLWGHSKSILVSLGQFGSFLVPNDAVLGQSGSFLGNFWVILDVRKTEISYLDNII